MGQWQIPGYLESRNSILTIDGAGAEDLAKTFGTPLFVFSENRIRQNARLLQETFSHDRPRTRIFYASKANSNLAVLQIIRDAGLDVEVNSGGELYKALKAGFAPGQIIFNGVAKTEQEIHEAVTANIFCLNVDSQYELERLIAYTQRTRTRARIALRIVPEVGGDTHPGLETGTADSKFGISPHTLLNAYQLAIDHSEEIDLIGLHMHIGAQLVHPESYREGFSALLTTAAKLTAATGHVVSHLNIGGGFPVPFIKDGEEYLQDEIAADDGHHMGGYYRILKADISLSEIDKALLDQLNDPILDQRLREISPVFADALPGIEILFEPGTSVIADTAVLLTTVQNYKQRYVARYGNWLMLDAGFNTLLDVMAYNWYFHALAAGRTDEPATFRYRLAGPLCDSADVYHDTQGLHRLPEYRLLPEGIRPGDLMAFTDVGGYTLEQMCQYNGQPRAAAVLIRLDGSQQIIRRRETYEDLSSLDVTLEEL